MTWILNFYENFRDFIKNIKKKFLYNLIGKKKTSSFALRDLSLAISDNLSKY